MKKLLHVVVIVTLALFGLTFSYKNHQTVELTYYFGLHSRLDLSLLLFMTFALGLGAGCLITLFSTFIARRRPPKAAKTGGPPRV